MKIKKLLKSSIKWIVIVIVLGAAGFWFFQSQKPKEEQTVEFETEAPEKMKPVPVEAQPAFIGDLVVRVSATGIARARQQVTITPRVSGQIAAIYKTEGMRVKKGDVIFKIDDTTHLLNLETAEDALTKAQGTFVDRLMSSRDRLNAGTSNPGGTTDTWYIEWAKEEYEKAKKGFREGKLTQLELDQAKDRYETVVSFTDKDYAAKLASQTGLTSAMVTKKQKEMDLENTRVKAPFSGILGNQMVSVGGQVSAGKECFTLVDLSKLRIEANALESEIKDIIPGRKARVKFAAFPGEEFEGKIAAVNPLIDPETKTCRVTVEMDNPGFRIKDGMSAMVNLEATIYKDRLLVPRDAILVRDTNRDLLFIIRDNLAKWSYVEIGHSNDEYVEIPWSKMELKAGELVITDGHYSLIHDAPVKVEEKE